MFNNLYQVEQAGREHQQALLAVQYQAEQVVQSSGTSARAPRFQAFHMVVERICNVIGGVVHPRTTAGWLGRLFVLVATVAVISDARPAAAAVSTGASTAGQAHGQLDPASTGGTHAVSDPFRDGSASTVQVPTSAGGFTSIQDPSTLGGTHAVVDPGTDGGSRAMQELANVTVSTSAATTAPATTPVEYLIWLLLLVAVLMRLTLRERTRA